MEEFWKYIHRYATISTAAQEAWQELLKEQKLARHEHLLLEGAIPRRVHFIKKGLLSYFYTDKDGAMVIKKFFPEQTLVASTSAMLLKQPSKFTIQALEETEIISYPFEQFSRLTALQQLRMVLFEFRIPLSGSFMFQTDFSNFFFNDPMLFQVMNIKSGDVRKLRC